MKRPLLAVAAAFAALALAAPTARADSPCPAQPLERTFLPWLDPSWYQQAPDGDFEGQGRWAFLGGAAVVDGSQPYLEGARSLALPAGSVATTPPICVSVAHPTIRFFARNTGNALAPLTVSVVFNSLLGQLEVPVGVVLSGQQWAPSPVVPIVANLLSREVRFRFRPAGGDWRIDDVFVDPYSKG